METGAISTASPASKGTYSRYCRSNNARLKELAVTDPKIVLIDRHPGRNSQTIGIARELGTDPDLIHEPSVGVVGTKGVSQCYMGVVA